MADEKNNTPQLEEFEAKLENNEFLEYTNYCGNYYGTLKQQIEDKVKAGRVVILVIEVEGAQQVKKKMPDCVMIFIVPPGKEALYERLRARGTESEEIIGQRIEKANREFKKAYLYDYIVVNDEVNNAADRIMAIIRAEHAKTQRTIREYMKMVEEK